ncbi:MAG: DUF4291 domain-containing protein [Candidatus Sumerlaeia bacterium]
MNTTDPENDKYLIRANYDDKRIRVYQAYHHAIADAAIAIGTFRSGTFNMDRMTWIKPSFLWMMYRCGWGEKDENQSRVLAIDITREGFDWCLKTGILSTYHQDPYGDYETWKRRLHGSPVRIQWDPERGLSLNKLNSRTIQIGLRGIAVERYVSEWILQITDITEQVKQMKRFLDNGQREEATKMLPEEEPYCSYSR